MQTKMTHNNQQQTDGANRMGAKRTAKTGRAIADLKTVVDLEGSRMSSIIGGKPWYEKTSTWVGVGESTAEIGVEVAE